MIAQHTTDEGYKLEVFSSLYLDYGFRVLGPENEVLYYNPCYFSNESYGCHWEDEEDNPLDEGIPWTAEEWVKVLAEQSDDLLEELT